MTANELFKPVSVGRYLLPHRIAMAPMTRNRTPGSVPNAMNALYYSQRASAALIVTEGVSPSATGYGYLDTPGLHTDEQVRGWREVTDAVHARGGRIFAQLMHVGRMSHPDFQGGELPLAPSAIRPAGEVRTGGGKKPHPTPRAMEHGEILQVIDDHAAAARKAVEAGFDGVELHGANGYLAHQFLAAGSNVRTDRWGGSAAARARFLLETVDAMGTAIGFDRVGVRISPGNPYNDISEPDAQDSYWYISAALKRRVLAYLHLVDVKPGFDVRQLIRWRFDGPLILNGGFDAESAAEAIRSGAADLVSFGQAFLANPDLPERIRAGAPLNVPYPATFYGGGAEGYVDYPSLAPPVAEAA
jgi:N-ethylmaleimide reductase